MWTQKALISASLISLNLELGIEPGIELDMELGIKLSSFELAWMKDCKS